MSVFSEAAGFSRLAWDLKAFLRQRLLPDAARATLRSRLARRDANFLEMVDRRIVAVPASPYRSLLALAGCESGDLEHLVRTRGPEATLRQLRAEGVYVTFDEFKGRAPTVRRGREILSRRARSGTTGRGPRTGSSAPSTSSRRCTMTATAAYDDPRTIGAPRLVNAGLRVRF